MFFVYDREARQQTWAEFVYIEDNSEIGAGKNGSGKLTRHWRRVGENTGSQADNENNGVR